MLEPGSQSRTTDGAVDAAETIAPRRLVRRSGLSGFAAVDTFAAWAGAVGLVAGGLDFGDRLNDRLPFDSVVLAGLALAVIVAIPLTLLAWSAWTGADRTNDVALIVGLILIGWIVVQVVVLRAFSIFQPAYLCVGVSFVAVSHRVGLGHRRQGLLLAGIGALIAPVGLGLVPHLIKSGLGAMSAVGVLVSVIGVGSLVVGARLVLRDRHRVGSVAGGCRDPDRARHGGVDHCACRRGDPRPGDPRG